MRSPDLTASPRGAADSPPPGPAASWRTVLRAAACLGLATAVLPAPQPAAAGPARSVEDPAQSVATVDEMLRLENDKAREVTRRAREQAGPGSASSTALAPSAGTRQPIRAAAVTIESISRVGDGPVRVALSVDGQRWDAATVGTRVGACEIVRVAGPCVHWTAVLAKRRQPPRENPCPVSCWTGLPPPVAHLDGPLPSAPQATRLAAPPPPLPLLPPRTLTEAGPGGGVPASLLR